MPPTVSPLRWGEERFAKRSNRSCESIAGTNVAASVGPFSSPDKKSHPRRHTPCLHSPCPAADTPAGVPAMRGRSGSWGQDAKPHHPSPSKRSPPDDTGGRRGASDESANPCQTAQRRVGCVSMSRSAQPNESYMLQYLNRSQLAAIEDRGRLRGARKGKDGSGPHRPLSARVFHPWKHRERRWKKATADPFRQRGRTGG